MNNLNGSVTKLFSHCYGKTNHNITVDESTKPASENNAYVTKIDRKYYTASNNPCDARLLLDDIITTDSIIKLNELKEELSQKLISMSDVLYEQRSKFFVIKNKYKDDVYGELSSNATLGDRDEYITKLIEYHDIKTRINQLSDKDDASGNRNVNRYSNIVPHMHHSGVLYGDLRAIDNIMAGLPGKIPDLTYNQGSCQFG